jgi:hypothetical protein
MPYLVNRCHAYRLHLTMSADAPVLDIKAKTKVAFLEQERIHRDGGPRCRPVPECGDAAAVSF